MHAHDPVLVLLIVFGLGGLGVLIVLYGTVAKNKWGINLDPVSCPRCKASLPSLREPGSVRQAMWGGWTCPNCGAGVDKWGREVVPIAPPTVVKTEGEMGAIIRKRFIRKAPVIFCVLLLLDWTGIIDGGFPSTWGKAFVQVGANVAWTLFFMVIFYFAGKYIGKRFLLPKQGSAESRSSETLRH